jgi:lipopolysaccharide biosynthesis protein
MNTETIQLGPERPSLIAFYLPQFHPIPENDSWWGRGFTEWSNVTKARPLFPGHYQPKLPADLGFYDLRVPETRAAQAELARAYGLSAFCYWHYWFAGRRILERPFTEVLRSGEPQFPFCLAWANQAWSGIWHGNPDRILIEQRYPGPEDDTRHFYAVVDAFLDSRYFKVDDKPLFYVYEPSLMPEPKRFTDTWRELAHRTGLRGLHFVAQVYDTSPWNPSDHGFDAVVIQSLPPLLTESSWDRPRLRLRTITRRLRRWPTVYSYRKVLSSLIPEPPPTLVSYPCVVPNWDNTPRSGVNGLVLHDARPEYFGLLLRAAFARIPQRTSSAGQRPLVFIKSWNEWAEGNYLEPDRQFGHGYLQAIQAALAPFAPATGSG